MIHHSFKVFNIWSPYVPKGYITEHLTQIGEDLTLVINPEYKQRVSLLQDKASKEHRDTGNPVFRVLQIMGALRD